MEEIRQQVIGMTKSKALNLINGLGMNACTVSEDGKLYNKIGSRGNDCIYLTIVKRIVINADC
jgi:hypothetical protein